MSLVTDPFERAWLDAELGHLGISHVACTKIEEILDALATDAPDLVLVDLSRHALDMFRLRERGWFGPLYAIGEASRNLCYALGVTNVLHAPLSRDAFRDALSPYANDRLATVRKEERTTTGKLRRVSDGVRPARERH
jgi:uroporphyrinogen-III synthase